MATFSAFHVPGQVMHESNMATLARLDSMGVRYRQGFYSTAMPHIQFIDLTKGPGDSIDMPYFASRLTLGNGMLAAGESPFNADGLHITLVKWGPGENDCGRVIVDESVCLSECSIVSYCEVRIDQGVLFGPGVYMFDCDQSPADPQGPRFVPANMEMAPIRIEERAWCGANVIVMPGVTIGHHATIGTGSVVYKNVDAHTLATGNPAVAAAKFA